MAMAMAMAMAMGLAMPMPMPIPRLPPRDSARRSIRAAEEAGEEISRAIAAEWRHKTREGRELESTSSSSPPELGLKKTRLRSRKGLGFGREFATRGIKKTRLPRHFKSKAFSEFATIEKSPRPPPRQRGSIFEQNLSAASAASASASASASPAPSPSPSPSASGFWIGTGSSVASFLASVPVVMIAYDYPPPPPAPAGQAPGFIAILCSASLGFLNFLATTEKWIFTTAEWSAFCRWSATFTALAYGISAAQLVITRKSLPKCVRVIATPILYVIACVVPSIFGRAFRHDPHGWAYGALAVSYGIFWGLPFLMRSFASWARWYVGVWGDGAELGFTTEPRFMVSSMLSTIAALLWVFYSDTVEHHDGHFVISIVASIGGACVFLGQLVVLLRGKER